MSILNNYNISLLTVSKYCYESIVEHGFTFTKYFLFQIHSRFYYNKQKCVYINLYLLFLFQLKIRLQQL